MCFVFLSLAWCEILKDRKLSISTEGSWSDTPLLSEAAAFIADASGEAYWAFIRGLQKTEKLPTTTEEIRKYALDFLSDDLRALLDLSLKTRAYSPRIEMFREIARNYSKDTNRSFAVYAQKTCFSTEELKTALATAERSRPIVYPFEPRKGRKRDTVIIYAPISDPSLFAFVDLIEKYEEEFSFVLRPIGQLSDAPVRFRGYGFELRPFNYSMTYAEKEEIRNVEYGRETPDSKLMKLKHVVPGPDLPNA